MWTIFNERLVEARKKCISLNFIEIRNYGTSTRDIAGNVDRNKYDGVIFINVKDSWIDDEDYQDASTIYVTFKANQIKSVDNDGTWDIGDDNIFS